MRRVIALLCGVALGGCSLEPRYVRPEPPVPPSWPIGAAYPAAAEALPAVTYQDIFRDPRLQAIIAQALAGNQDLAVALANVASARAEYRVQRAELLPRIDASGDVRTGRGARGNYGVDFGLSAFEIDLFGRVRSLSRAALQQYLASEAAARTARLTLVAEVASTYLTLAADRSLLAVAVDTERNAARSVELTRLRLNGGIVPRTDLRQAETILQQARSDRADLITAVAQDRNGLELLVGAPVVEANLPTSIESVDGLLAELPAGLDSRVLLRRPDVAQAEHVLRAANAQIGAARAAFFPTISLTAIAGLASTALGSLFSGDAFTWSAGPSASLPIFDAGARRGNLAFARAQRDVAIARYRQAIQTAFREVADALARRGTIALRFDAQNRLAAAARDSFTLQEARYREGIDTYLATLDAQRTLYAARRSLATTRLVRADNLVELYRSLGGDMLVDTERAR